MFKQAYIVIVIALVLGLILGVKVFGNYNGSIEAQLERTRAELEAANSAYEMALMNNEATECIKAMEAFILDKNADLGACAFICDMATMDWASDLMDGLPVE